MHSTTRRFARWFLDGKATAGIFVTLTLLVAAGFASQLFTHCVSATSRRVEHTHKVLHAVDALRAALIDAEAAQRSYVLSGNPFYLNACSAGLSQAQDSARMLRSLAGDYSEQERRLDTLGPLLEKRLAQLRNTIDRPNGDIRHAAEQLVKDDDRPALDELRKLLTAIRDDELGQLVEQSPRSEAAIAWLSPANALSSMLALVMAAGAVLAMNRSAARRFEAEAALHHREEADCVREQQTLRRSHVQLEVALGQSEEARRASDELVRGVFHAAPLALIVLDLDGLVRLWNPAAERAFGWSEGEVLGHTYPLVPPNREAEFHDLFARAVGGAALLGVETQRRSKAGKPVDVVVSAAPLRGVAGDVTGVLVLLADATERKALEAEVRRAQKLEVVGRLAGGVAHDFNNLLTVINGCCDLLLLRFPTPDPARELLDAVHGAGERAAGLTRQLLAFGRRQIVQPHVLDLNVIVADLVRLLARLIGEDITLELCCDPAPAVVCGDRGQLEQIVMNLALNARDAMPQGGRLQIETRHVELDESYAGTHLEVQAGPYVLLWVRDTGVGMDEAMRAHLFEPFFTTKGPGKGTGLGLATVYTVVKQMCGDIEFDSAPGEGTTVSAALWHGATFSGWPGPQRGSRIADRGKR